MRKVQFSNNKRTLQKIIELRYEVLRKPWQQPIETATDDLDEQSFNAFIENENQEIIACGRLQINEKQIGQIRYMAVFHNLQGQGYGQIILKFLETKAKEIGLQGLELQARENAVKFYENNGYNIKEKSFLLWGQIQHYLMVKNLQ